MNTPKNNRPASVVMDEKADDIQLENKAYDSNVDPDFERKSDALRRKLDWRFMPMMVLMFCLNHIDRNNLAAAKITKMTQEIGLTDVQFQTCLSILYVGYLTAQVGSNIIIHHVRRPALYICFWVVVWGVVSTVTGTVRNFGGLLTCRLFLGFLECPYFAGCNYLLSRWYTKNELALRMAILYSGSMISQMFGNLLAAGLINGLDGALGHEGWRWLYFVEGAITILAAVVAVFILLDYPETTTGITEEERTIALKRIILDAGEADVDEHNRHWTWGFRAAVSDYKVWLLVVLATAENAANSYSKYFPSLAKTLGYSNTITLLLAAPPWFVVWCVNFFWSWHSDRHKERAFHVAIPMCFALVGMIIAASTSHEMVAARYVSLFLMVLSYSGYAISLTWVANTVARPPAKRTVALALVNSLSQTGNICAGYMWPTMYAPSYRPSFIACAAVFVFAISLTFFIRQCLIWENLKLEQAEQEFLARQQEADVLKVQGTDAVVAAANITGVALVDQLAMKRGWRYML
ncbi:hypothetical protein FRC03_009576 [Tulasnella sp. 419]|nr:hypothetical protein FRC03_009576 [Tulasnella sp. 419]